MRTEGITRQLFATYTIGQDPRNDDQCQTATAISRTMSASFARITGWSISRLPKVFRLRAHRKASSRKTRAPLLAWQQIPHRSWLKLYMMQRNPAFSFPMTFSTGTFTFSKVTYDVPDGHTPWHFICDVVTPPYSRAMSSKEMPSVPGPPVRTAVVK